MFDGETKDIESADTQKGMKFDAKKEFSSKDGTLFEIKASVKGRHAWVLKRAEVPRMWFFVDYFTIDYADMKRYGLLPILDMVADSGAYDGDIGTIVQYLGDHDIESFERVRKLREDSGLVDPLPRESKLDWKFLLASKRAGTSR
ncbi:MAG: hypothetical protein LBO78_03225 [Rickettsiales bacterium]|jgi:hypothetical protein|nr:hypothetical protein [Rickettsiales bacterium]